MKSLVDILVLILQDCGMKCGANPKRDIITVTRRTEYEGDSFLTITLPTFAQGFERALDIGRLSPALFPKFRFRRGTCCPRFLGGYMERIFGPDGVLLENAPSDCIFAIRQICLFAKRVNLPCSNRRRRLAEGAYLGVEAELRKVDVPYTLCDAFNRIARIVWGDIVGKVPSNVLYRQLTPRHGPGTTVEGIRGNRKFLFPSWPLRLESEFPFTEFGIASIRNIFDESSFAGFSQPVARDETPVKVVFVPKTLKSPRVIAMEPVCMQYIQQSIANWIRPRIEHSCPFTKGRVNFTRQSVNSNLALSSSFDRRYATIDMSEASDRVSSILVRDMLASVPSFRKQVFACRSTRASLPSGITIPLRKFASMGSALCFPMEAMAFFLAIITIRIVKAGVRITPRQVLKHTDGVYVYGDDIIVPTDEAPSICDGLESFGFKVNSHKSFWTGKFRESCGMDAYNGTDVTPVYVRRMLPVDRSDAHGVASCVALANQFYLAGMWLVARELRVLIERILGPMPSISVGSHRNLERAIDGRFQSHKHYAGLGWISFSNAESFNGWHHDYQCLKSKRWVVTPIRRRDPIQGDAALLKCFGTIGTESIDPRHLRESVRYGNLALKRRWIPL